MRWLIPLLLGCACLVPAAADTPVAPAAACDTAAHRQFDFWIGDWDVQDANGKVAGRNRIARVHGGCGIQEQWSGNGGMTGSSLNAYDVARGQWHQTWIDNTGNVLLLEGAWRDGRMVLSGKAPLERGAQAALHRITWQPLADGRVRQLWEASTDDGRTWSVVFDGYYTRRKDDARPIGGRGFPAIAGGSGDRVLALRDLLEQPAIERREIVRLA